MKLHTLPNGDTLKIESDGRDYSPEDSGYRQRYTYVITTPAWEFVGNDIRSGVGFFVNEADMLRTLAGFLSACAESRGYPDGENADLFPEHVGVWAEANSDELSMLSEDPRDSASDAGYEAGKSVGAWVVDGDTSDETKARIRRGYDDGDPEILDMQPSPLSGEFADGPTIASVLSDYGMTEDDDEADDVLSAYEDGFSRGYWAEVLSHTDAE